jgi:hypothetical protein
MFKIYQTIKKRCSCIWKRFDNCPNSILISKHIYFWDIQETFALFEINL